MEFLLSYQETCIELVVIGEDGIVESVCEQYVFGTIKDLAVIPQSSKLYSNSLQVSIFHLSTVYCI